MTLLLDSIRYYTAEKNSQAIGEVICLRLSQNVSMRLKAPNSKK